MFSKLSYKSQRKMVIISFLAIPFFLLLLFTYWPTILMFYYSFTDWNGFSPICHMIGIDNYITIFTTSMYWKLFENSLYYLVSGILQITFAFLLAVLLNSKVRFKNVFKGIIVFPYLLNGVAISLIFIAFFKFNGTFNSILDMVGLNAWAKFWITDANIANYSLAFTAFWRYFGFNFILFLGAMQSIPGELFEAAKIDGASAWQEAKYIIIPSIKRIIEINLILTIAGAIKVFEIPYIMTGGANGTNTFVVETMQTAFGSNRVGLASAMAVIVLIIVLIVTVIQRKFLKEDI
ncbi:MAG TPA: sugar ABC transporter permease [Victivallales bacterium]|nr:sugar ABC transporter permease [Victivallales bacterium]